MLVGSLDDLFDIATANAIEKMKLVEDKKFLEMQRQKGRPGCMMGVDKVLYDREVRAQERQEKAALRKRRYEEQNFECSDIIEESNENDIVLVEAGNENVVIPLEKNCLHTECKKRRGTKSIIIPRLLAALDNAKVSDGMAVHILVAAAEALGHCVEELVINRSTIHRIRQQNRSAEFKDISTEFKEKANANGAF
ncbi:uncharacterized protein LOC125776370 [Bactrocera dorsalis]|uniref:Uncharacterized protein LOC125776370 n=1 Tax=Bactrocera dorsalis TaxID=27457 RepID=A0ABM3J4C5_BACDO|nr:uncharacterized protein LOC125776370 [Bactrocera dorsalis]